MAQPKKTRKVSTRAEWRLAGNWQSLKRLAVGLLTAVALPLAGYLALARQDLSGIYALVLSFVPALLIIGTLPRLRLGLSATYLFVMPFLIYSGNTSYGYTKIIFSLLVISLLLLLWVVEMALKGEYRFNLTGLIWPGLALVGAGLLSLVHSQVFWGDFQSMALLIYFFVFALLVANTIASSGDLRLLLGSLLASGALASLYGLLQYYGALPGRPGYSGGPGVILSTLGNKNYFAGFIAYLFVPGLLLLTKAPLRIKLSTFLGLTLLLLGLLAADSYSAFLGALLSVVFLLLALGFYWRATWLARLPQLRAWPSRRARYATLTFMLLVLLGLALAGLRWGGAVVEPIFSKLSSPTLSTRLETWQIGLSMFRDHPLIGTGIGEYKRQYLPYKTRYLQTPAGHELDLRLQSDPSIGYNPRPIYAHNEYVQIAAEMGLVGLLAGALLIAMIFWSTLRRVTRSESPEGKFALLALLGGVVAFLGDAFFSFPLHLPANALVLAFFLGALYSPALGASKLEVRLRPAVGLVIAVFIAAVAIGVSGLAYRDFQADLALSQARDQFAQGDYQGALPRLQRSVALSFSPSENLAWLARTYQALAKASDDAPQRQLLQEKSIRTFERSLASFDVELSYYQLATLYFEQDQYEKAEHYLEQLLATNPEPQLQANAQYLQILIAFRRQESQSAVDLLQKLSGQYPDYEQARLLLAQYQVQQGQYALAKETLLDTRAIIAKKLAAVNQILHPIETLTVPTETYYQARSEQAQLQQEQEAVDRLLQDLP